MISFWTEATDATLRELWADKTVYASAIGRIMHTTKGAIIGRAHRLSLPARACGVRRAVSISREPSRKPRPHFDVSAPLGLTTLPRTRKTARSRHKSREDYILQLGRPDMVHRPPTPPRAWEPRNIVGEPVSLGLTLMALTDKTCKFPHGTGPYIFCGTQTSAPPYCEFHSRLTRQPPDPRRLRREIRSAYR